MSKDRAWIEEDESAVGWAVGLMVQNILTQLLKPIKKQMKTIVQDIGKMADNITINQEKIAEVYSTMQATLTDMISNIEVEQQTELMQRVTELQSNLDDLKADVESNTEDTANHSASIESIETNITEIENRIRKFGDI